MTDFQPREDDLSETPNLVEPLESLKIKVAVIGPQRSGKSSLTRTLTGITEHFSPGFLDLYFSGGDGSLEISFHPYPPLPNVVILDYPGYKPSDSVTPYLEGIKVDTLHLLVMTIGESVSDTDLQLLGALRQLGKPYCVVQTHTDLALHTEKRHQGNGYWRGKTLQELRERLKEKVESTGIQINQLFLVSTLVPESFDFSRMVDFLEGEILQCKRSATDSIDNPCQELVEVFKTTCDKMGMAEFAPLLSKLLDNPPPISAVVGVTGNDKEGVLYALSETPNSGLCLKPLPGPGNPPMSADQYLESLQLECCDVYLIVDSSLDPSDRTTIMESLVTSGKHCMLISADENQCSETDIEGQAGKRRSQVDSDLPGLKVALEKGVPQLVRERLLHSLSSIIKHLVRGERRRLMSMVYDLCLDVCAKASCGQFQEALSSLSSALTSFHARLGLDDISLANIAQVTGCPIENLRSEIHSPMVQDLSADQLEQMVSQPISITAWVWQFIPHWGEVEPSKLCPERTYRLLVDSVWGMADDAERVILQACTKQKKVKEKSVICHWPCV
ncbi:uncharacterized protein LOC128639058 [Bombina bombina]|uniref:uncharacterized protein LOC128639058 n=1 Tax=Bombina bombina TaxID=8345 RepID=UPI00235A9696|nr:uncharacterized protein LOC128639058 [Bombina bombina]